MEKLSKEEFIYTQIFDAPRDLVYRVHTEAEHLIHWWGPKTFKTTVVEFDLRPGGVFHYHMAAPNGDGMWGKLTYQEIVKPEKLVFLVSFCDEKGNSIRHPLSPTWPLEVRNVMTFTELEGKTTITARSEPYNSTKEERQTFLDGHPSMEGGTKGANEQLVKYLKEL